MRSKIVEGKNGKRYFIDNGGVRGYVEVTEAEYAAAFPDKPLGVFKTNSLKGWPRKSLAFGVNPNQVQEAQAYYEKLGVPTLFDPNDGKAIVRDNQHQREMLKARGCRNNDGGYGTITG